MAVESLSKESSERLVVSNKCEEVHCREQFCQQGEGLDDLISLFCL